MSPPVFIVVRLKENIIKNFNEFRLGTVVSVK